MITFYKISEGPPLNKIEKNIKTDYLIRKVLVSYYTIDSKLRYVLNNKEYLDII
jgi:hypothetical protein